MCARSFLLLSERKGGNKNKKVNLSLGAWACTRATGGRNARVVEAIEVVVVVGGRPSCSSRSDGKGEEVARGKVGGIGEFKIDASVASKLLLQFFFLKFEVFNFDNLSNPDFIF